jgi:hypothetical protein
MKQDMQQRKALARIDDYRRRSTVSTARDIVYDKNYAVNSKVLDPLLTEQSLVPTIVSLAVTCQQMSNGGPVECILSETFSPWLQWHVRHACRRHHARVRIRCLEGTIYSFITYIGSGR